MSPLTDDEVTPEPNDFVRPCAVAISAILAIWSVAGWLAAFGVSWSGALTTALTLAFEALSLNASAQWRRAATREGALIFERFWLVALVVSAAWSVVSAHHAYRMLVAEPAGADGSVAGMAITLIEHPALVVLTLAGFLAPFLPWAIEGVERSPRRKANVVSTPPGFAVTSRTAGGARVVSFEPTAASVLAGLGIGAANMTALQDDLSDAHTRREPPVARVETVAALSHESARAHAIALKRTHPEITERVASAIVGRSRATIGRYWRDAGLGVAKESPREGTFRQST